MSNTRNKASISISGALKTRLDVYCGVAGVTATSVIERVLRDLPSVADDRVVIDVPAGLYRRAGKIARRRVAPISDTIEAAILRALDDAERWPTHLPRRRKPRVDHASRRAS